MPNRPSQSSSGGNPNRRHAFGDGEGDAISLEDLCCALRDYGLRVARHATPFWVGSYTQLQGPALLIMKPDRFDTWHAAVWDAEHRRILDPLPRPAKRPVVVGYVEVAHAAAQCAQRRRKRRKLRQKTVKMVF